MSGCRRWECATVSIPTGGGGGDLGVREWCRCCDKGIGCCQEHMITNITIIVVVPMHDE